MEVRLSADRASATIATVRPSDQMVSEQWFPAICRELWPKDAGFALHVITGFEERTCYRYAAGDRKPPAFFLRSLLRSEQGRPWLNAVMDGSTAQWWRDVLTADASRQKLHAVTELLRGGTHGTEEDREWPRAART
jgi:hypothetical protein